MHGRLGLDAAGECCKVAMEPVPWRMSSDERKDAHRGFCFNSRVSASVSVDRVQSDQRTWGCQARHGSLRKCPIVHVRVHAK
eukprot:852096-Amphidinium_carterae.2